MVLKRARNLHSLILEGYLIKHDIYNKQNGLFAPIPPTSLAVRYNQWEGDQVYQMLFRSTSDTCAATPDSFLFLFQNPSNFETGANADQSQSVQHVLNSCTKTLTSPKLGTMPYIKYKVVYRNSTFIVIFRSLASSCTAPIHTPQSGASGLA